MAVKIKVLFPTIRPKMMKKAWALMLSRARNPEDISIAVAVNTEKQKAQLVDVEGLDIRAVKVVGDSIRGVTHAAYQLTRKVKMDSENDIIILMSDDFEVPKKWDHFVKSHLHKWHGCLMINDGYQTGGCVTFPIMTYGCLLRLNRVIYHPSYIHLFSDAELHDNLKQLNMLKNLRKPKYATFEHKHWACSKRKMDAVDSAISANGGKDEKNYNQRQRWPLEKKLKVKKK